MKAETVIVITKAFCYMLVGAGTALATSLGQWSNSAETPGRIQWLVIIVGTIVGGATQLLSFLSGSYSDYMKGRTNGNALPAPPAETTLPTTEKPKV